MTSSPPELAVVIATRDRAAALEGALASVLAQRGAAVEAIVVDDGSTDRTPELLRRLAAGDGRVVPVAAGGVGRSAARNLGLERARAPWVSILDDDDLLAPAFARVMLAAAREGGGAAVSRWATFHAPVTEPVAVADLRADPERFRLREDPWGPLPRRLTPEDLFARTWFPVNAAVARRELLLELGGFPAGMERAEDHLLWLRLAARLGSLPVVPRVLAYVREHGERSTRDLGGMARGTVAALETILVEHPWLRRRVGRAAVRRRLAALHREVAYAELLAGRRGPALRAAAAAVLRHPLELKAWLYLALAPVPGMYRALRRRRAR